MKFNHIYAVYFSPTGNTKKVVTMVAERLAQNLSLPLSSLSLDLPEERKMVHQFKPTDLVVVGGPTYAGKLPNKILPAYQEKLKGSQTLAIALVTFGNRSFDNSLAELTATLDDHGFQTIAAGAFVGAHAFNEKVLAPGRPDERDVQELRDLADQVKEKLQNLPEKIAPLTVPGQADAPYYVPKGLDGQPAKFLKAKPVTDTALCHHCGFCAKNCPMGAIDADDPSQVPGLCIKCQRCVKACPQGAKSFTDPAFLSHVKMLEKNYTRPAVNQIFL